MISDIVFTLWVLAVLLVMGFLVGLSFYELMLSATVFGRTVILFILFGAIMFTTGVIRERKSGYVE